LNALNVHKANFLEFRRKRIQIIAKTEVVAAFAESYPKKIDWVMNVVTDATVPIKMLSCECRVIKVR
jgi:hypothetical protein